MKTQRIGITWQLTDVHGWGIFGLNVALQLARHGPVPPLIISQPYFVGITPRINRLLGPYLKEQPGMLKRIEAQTGTAVVNEALMLHSLGNAFLHSPVSEKVRGHTNIGFIFFENGTIDDRALARARNYDKIIAGSSWNRDFIKNLGFESTSFISQGVDLERFQPREKVGHFPDRFVVFSGGKLELRKGQDIVLAAFKRFHERHPEALLLTNWHNVWPETFANLTRSPYIDSLPAADANGNISLQKWSEANGLPTGAHIDVGPIPNSKIPEIIAEADVALFPNRCEGGTNLVAMETMASGIPCILSANTGHLDIIGDDNCYRLERQTDVPADMEPSGVWKESDVEEIVETLEQVYQNREEAKKRANAGVAFMQNLSWERQTKALIEDLSVFL
ncbi:MAG: glycosyltransferase family 4 protein [Rhodospirillales bacterium]|nr:glycosyltransferase family 4 protein [Rhodospirillales bacterium]